MEKIIEQVEKWEYLQQIDESMAGFRFKMEKEQHGLCYRIFRYELPEKARYVTAIYDDATKEYSLRVEIGLTEYCEIAFIAADLERFEGLLQRELPPYLTSLAGFDAQALGSIFLNKHVLEWEYGKNLPAEIAGFHLFISPTAPVKGINGSFLIIDYSDFSIESNLIIYYNIYRDEFFGEVRAKRIPRMAAVFDAKSLPDLAENLQTYLVDTLTSLRAECDGIG